MLKQRGRNESLYFFPISHVSFLLQEPCNVFRHQCRCPLCQVKPRSHTHSEICHATAMRLERKHQAGCLCYYVRFLYCTHIFRSNCIHQADASQRKDSLSTQDAPPAADKLRSECQSHSCAILSHWMEAIGMSTVHRSLKEASEGPQVARHALYR